MTQQSKFEISKMLCLSTAHVSEQTAKFIENEQLHSFSSEYGYIIYVQPPEGLECPEDLSALIALARENKCDFLRLDRDGPIVETLQQFNW